MWSIPAITEPEYYPQQIRRVNILFSCKSWKTSLLGLSSRHCLFHNLCLAESPALATLLRQRIFPTMMNGLKEFGNLLLDR